LKYLDKWHCYGIAAALKWFRRSHGYPYRVQLTLKWYSSKMESVFGPKGEEEEGGWRRLENEELHHLYSLPNVIRVIK